MPDVGLKKSPVLGKKEKEEITEGRKAGRASKTKPAPPRPLTPPLPTLVQGVDLLKLGTISAVHVIYFSLLPT